jgi:transcriptional regulator with XRE-family HTH domain
MPAIFGDFLKDLRKDHGYTLRAFAVRVGIDPGNYSRLERGFLQPPQDAKLAELAEALDLPSGSTQRQELFDRAAAARGEFPRDLLSDEEVVSKLPLLFQSLRSGPLTAERLDALVETIRRG